MAARWIGAAPLIVRVRRESFWANVIDWIRPCLPPGKVRAGANLASANAIVTVLESLAMIENCGASWLKESSTLESVADASEGVTAVTRATLALCAQGMRALGLGRTRITRKAETDR